MSFKSRFFTGLVIGVLGTFGLSATTLSQDLWLSYDNIYNVASNETIIGNYHSIHFSATGDPAIISVGNTYDLAFQHVVLKDFEPRFIGLGTGSSVLFDEGTRIQISRDVSIDMDYTMSFNGLVEMDCCGYEFDLTGMPVAFDILSGSTLAINNARIKGLKNWSDPNLRCLADDATLTLSNCELVLAADYSFTSGHLNLYRDVVVKGPYAFAYQSQNQATILGHSQFKFDQGTTFVYDSGVNGDASTAGNDHLVMVDQTSQLFLNGCSLRVTSTGLRLTTGTLLLDHINSVSCESGASDLAGALIFGDATDSSKDLSVEVLPGGSLDMVYGSLDYQNSEV